MCSIVTNLLTIATNRYWTRNGSVATQFNLLSSNATSSARGEYVAVPKRFGQIEELANKNMEWAKNNPSSVPKIVIEQHTVKPYLFFSEIICFCNK